MKTLINVIIWFAAFIIFSWFFEYHYPIYSFMLSASHFVGFGTIMASIFYPYDLLVMVKHAFVFIAAVLLSKLWLVYFILVIGVHWHHNVIKDEKA